MSKKPFRFAVQSFSASSAKEWNERARRVEALGYSALHLADHVIGDGPALQSTAHPLQELAAVPAIAAAAAATTTLRVGCRVFCQDYRHPVMLAKEAGTLDLLSEGRLELGIGAGWLEGEYGAMGIPFDRAGVRIDRLAETIAIVKAHMSGEQIDHAGEHFTVKGFSGAPSPTQKPHPPIMIGGGAKRILGLAGREADIVSLNFNNRSGMMGAEGVQLSTAEATDEKITWIKAGAGDRFDQIELEIGAYFTFVGDAAGGMATGMAGAFGFTEEEMRAHPHGLFGTPEEIVEVLEGRRERFGISYVTVGDNVIEEFAPVVKALSGK